MFTFIVESVVIELIVQVISSHEQCDKCLIKSSDLGKYGFESTFYV